MVIPCDLELLLTILLLTYFSKCVQAVFLLREHEIVWYVKSHYFTVLLGLIEFGGQAVDMLSFVLGPLLSLNQLCDKGNFT